MMKLLPVSVVVVVAVIVTSQAATVLVHQDVTLTCSIGPTAPRSSAVFWYSNGIHEYLTSDFTTINELNNTARSVYSRLSAVGSGIRGKYNLKITDVRPEDEGVYVCGYYQPNGTWFTVKTEKLDVLVPPAREFPACSVQTTSDALLAPGMLVNLTCISYGGNPPATLEWYRAGVRMEGVTAHGGLWVYLQHRILDSDSGVEFTCQASSPALSEPKSCSITPYRRASQLYIEHEHGGLVAMGESATFTCANRDILLHDDEVYYRWYINGALVEERETKTMIIDDGRSLTLLNITTEYNKSTVSCERVEELAARSSASMSILVVSPSSLNHPPVLYQPEQPDYSTKDPPLGPTAIGLTIGAFFCGMFLMLFLIFVLWLAANARRRGRFDVSHKSSNGRHFVGWQKIAPKTTDVEKLDRCDIHLEKSSPVRTFKKPISGQPATGISESVKGATVHRDDPSGGCNGVGVMTPPPMTMSQKAKLAASHDPLPTYKKPSPLRLMSESGRPLLPSSSPRSRGYSVDRDYTASMPDLALRYFGEPVLSALDHDYVNLPALTSSSPKDGSGSSTPSYVNCEFASTMSPPKSPRLSLPKSNPQKKSLSYAELDLPCAGDRSPTPVSPKSPAEHKSRAGSVSVGRTNYAEIAYVFKDRRQQSLPSVKLVGLSEGFGVKV
ncbi:uncharacterized protein [Asterias amurensis]|uniref:uncharacterized protein n=1 Tax=Asterias amurensis TaxID=7602 RepID=UPI003AB37891